jgi:hypothetical protein
MHAAGGRCRRAPSGRRALAIGAKTKKTSQNDPIRVDCDAAEEHGRPGRLGLTIAPGKRDPGRDGERDLRHPLVSRDLRPMPVRAGQPAVETTGWREHRR